MQFFAGLDGEMSGPNVGTHKLIEIGIALDQARCFSSRIGWKDCKFDREALRAIGWQPEELQQGPGIEEVDQELSAWLAEMGVGAHSLVPVGWGVTTFDLPFVVTSLPRASRFLHHHAIELNAICYTLANFRAYRGELLSLIEWKNMSKSAAAARIVFGIDREANWHNAGYDALASLEAWKWLREVIADPLSAGTS